MTPKTIAGILLCALSACAETLSLQQAIAMALKTHPDMLAATFRQENARAESRNVHAALSPRIDATLGYYPTKTSVIPSNGAFTTRQSEAFHADVTASYLLWDFGRSDDRYRAALHKNSEADANREASKNILIEAVRLRYFTLAYLDALRVSEEQSFLFYQAQYERALHLRQNGLRTEADESRFYALHSEAKERLESTRTEAAKTRLSLELLIGSAETVRLSDDELERLAGDVVLSAGPEVLRKELSERNPTLKALRAQVDQARLQAEASGKERYGNVSLVASYGYDNALSSYDSSLVGAVGTIPLYDGGKLNAQAQQSRIALALAQKEYESRERAAWEELFGTYSDFIRADAQIASKQNVIDATKKALDLMEGRYTQGLATYVDVLESRSALDAAVSDLAGAKFKKIAAWAHVQQLLNKGCENDVCND